VAAIEDTGSDPRLTPSERAALQGIDIGAVLGIPLVRDGRVVAVLSTHSRTPRPWTEDDIGLVHEVAARTWPWVERARVQVALQESEARFRALAEMSPLGVAVSSAEGEIVYSNRAYAEILGLEPDDLVGRPSTFVYYDPADRNWLAAMREKGHLRGVEVRFRHKDGDPVWVSINVAPVDYGGRNAIIGVVQDITERKRAEEALRRSGDRHAFLLTLSDTLRPLLDVSHVKAAAARALGEHLRVTRAFYAEIHGDDWLIAGAYDHDGPQQADGGHPWPTLTSWIVDAFREGQRLVVHDVEADTRFTPSDRAGHQGDRIAAAVAVPLIKDSGLVAVLAVESATSRQWQEHDVELVAEAAERIWQAVERARVEDSLRASEQRMRMAIRATGIVTWEWVPSQDRITTSDSFADVYGLPALAHAADGFALVLPEDAQQHLDKVQAIASQGGSYTSQFRIRRPDDGQIVWLEERAEAKTGPDGTVERVIGVTLDITERKSRGPNVLHRGGDR
jgi:PAS domain S-box-containing protein